MANACALCGLRLGWGSGKKRPGFGEREFCHTCGAYLEVLELAGAGSCDKIRYHLSRTYLDAKLEEGHADDAVRRVVVGLVDKAEGAFREQEKRSRPVDLTSITTGFGFEGFSITAYHGPVSGTVAMGTGSLSGIAAGFSDLFGEESSSFAKKMSSAKDAACERLMRAAIDVGGNAVIGLDYDYVEVKGLIGVSANGISVTVERLA